jgi:pilus assembly protein FimV
LSVYSGIGQQLNAEVALNATPAELSSMSARLASPEAFKEAGIEWMPALADLQIKMEKSAAGQPVLKLTTNRPVTEPFLHFLVELSWSSGRVIREYTFLLDPPEMLQPAKPASVVAPIAPAPERLPAQAALASPAPAPAPAITKSVAPSASEYQVKAGDTLAKIARETRPESVTLDQMLVALFEKNAEAFAGGNMNRLRAGKILRIPAAEEVSKVDPAAARKLVISQTSEFDAYRRRLAAAVASAPAPSAEALPRQQASGAIKPQVEDKTPVAPAQDKLEVSRTEPAKAKQTPGGGLEEELIARDKALREAAERIAQLEKNIENLKKLVEIKSQTGAALQQPSEPVAPATKPVEPQPPAPKAEEAKPSAPADVTPAKPVEPAPATAAGPAPQPVKPATPPPAAKKPAAPPPPEEEPSFVAENPELVYGGGGLIALLLGYLGYSVWKRRQREAGKSIVAEPSMSQRAFEQTAALERAGGEEISIHDELAAAPEIDISPQDPVAEADALMAYGRDQEAEGVLKAALAKDPTRTAVHLKLLKLYAKQKNLDRFEAAATRFHQLVKGQGEEWERVVEMAHALGHWGGIFAVASASPAAMERKTPPEESALKAGPMTSTEAEWSTPEDDFDLNSLDSELDRDLGSGVEAAAASDAESPPAARTEVAEPAPSGHADDEAAPLDFELDLDSLLPEEGAASVSAESAATVVAEEPPAEPPSLLDLELAAEESEKGLPAEKEKSAEASFDLDFDLAPPETGEDKETSLQDMLGATGIFRPADGSKDAGLHFDFDLELEEAAPSEKPESAQDAERREVTEVVPVAASAEPEPDNVEAATKLELAEAYEEMGDLEGARELLNEVLNEGSAAQQALAKAKLEKLAAS